jgi:hypothetical protein
MDAGLRELLGGARGGSATSVPDIQSRMYWSSILLDKRLLVNSSRLERVMLWRGIIIK